MQDKLFLKCLKINSDFIDFIISYRFSVHLSQTGRWALQAPGVVFSISESKAQRAHTTKESFDIINENQFRGFILGSVRKGRGVLT